MRTLYILWLYYNYKCHYPNSYISLIYFYVPMTFCQLKINRATLYWKWKSFYNLKKMFVNSWQCFPNNTILHESEENRKLKAKAKTCIWPVVGDVTLLGNTIHLCTYGHVLHHYCFKEVVHPKKKIYSLVYLPSSGSKPLWFSLFCWFWVKIRKLCN